MHLMCLFTPQLKTLQIFKFHSKILNMQKCKSHIKNQAHFTENTFLFLFFFFLFLELVYMSHILPLLCKSIHAQIAKQRVIERCD